MFLFSDVSVLRWVQAEAVPIVERCTKGYCPFLYKKHLVLVAVFCYSDTEYTLKNVEKTGVTSGKIAGIRGSRTKKPLGAIAGGHGWH